VDVSTGECLKTLQGIVAEFGQLALLPQPGVLASALRQQNSPDAHILASSSDDQTVKLWDWSTGHASEPCRDIQVGYVRLPLALKVVPLLVAVLIEQ